MWNENRLNKNRWNNRAFRAAVAVLGGAAMLLGTPKAGAQYTWFQSQIGVGAGVTEVGTSVEQTRDGGYVTVSNYRVGGLNSIVLRRFDRKGNVMLALRYAISGANCTAQSVRETSNGGFIIGGESTQSAGIGLLLIYLDPQLNCPGTGQSWAKVYAGVANSGMGGTVVRERSGGGFVAVGRAPSTGGGIYDAELVVVNGAGVRTAGCNFRYRGTPNLILSFNDVREESNGDYVIVGDYWPTDSQGRVIALRTTSCGNVVWSNLYGRIGIDNYHGESVTLKSADTAGAGFPAGAVIAGTVAVAGTPQAFAMRLNGGGAPVWEKHYPGYYGARSVREDRKGIPNEGIMLATRAVPEADSTQEIGLNVDGAIGFMGPRQVYVGTPDWFEEIIPTKDGGAVRIGGVSPAAGSPRTFLCKTGPIVAPQVASCSNDAGVLFGTSVTGFQPLSLIRVAETLTQTAPIVCSTVFQNATEKCVQFDSCEPRVASLVLGIPFDENASAAVNVVNPAFSATYFGNPLPVNTTTNSCSAPRRMLTLNGVDQYAQVPNYPAINVGTGDFTIAFRMRLSVAGNHPLMSILDKRAGSAGWQVYLSSTNRIGLNLSTGTCGSCFTNYETPALTIPANTCVCVAITVSRQSSNPAERVIRFWINGVLNTTFSGPIVRVGSVGNTGPMTIGRASNSSGQFLNGSIDELQMYNYDVGDAKPATLCNAFGNCPISVTAPNTSICTNVSQGTVKGYVCNNDTVARAFSIQAVGEPVGAGCTVGGPSIVSALPSTATIQPGQCQEVTIVYNRPPLLSLGARGCYSIIAQDTATGEVQTATGSITGIYSFSQCPPPWTNTEAALPTNLPTDQTYRVFNPTNATRNMPYRISAESEVIDPLGSAISLDDLPPGTPVVGSVMVPANSVVERQVKARFVRTQPTGYYSLELSLDLDLDGQPEPAGWMTLRNLVTGDCTADFNGDGFLAGDDFDLYSQLFELGDVSTDFDGDGFTTGIDFDLYVAAYEAGC